MSAPYDPTYQPVQYVPPPPESRVQGPAIGLLIAGGISAFLWILRTVLSALGMAMLGVVGMADPQMQNDPSALMALSVIGVLGIVFSLIPVVMNLAICWGAWKLMRLESYNWAMASAILALIPCQPPCCLLTMPFGIWALVLMSEQPIRDRLMQGRVGNVGEVFD